jgi:hypothetical protein
LFLIAATEFLFFLIFSIAPFFLLH